MTAGPSSCLKRLKTASLWYGHGFIGCIDLNLNFVKAGIEQEAKK
jgi:hypothetical protein